MRLLLIALWDLAARVRGEPLHSLLGDLKRPAYASLLRIGDPTLVANECETVCGAASQRRRPCITTQVDESEHASDDGAQ